MTVYPLFWNNQSSSAPKDCLLKAIAFLLPNGHSKHLILCASFPYSSISKTNYAVRTQQLPELSLESYALCIPVSSCDLQKSLSVSPASSWLTKEPDSDAYWQTHIFNSLICVWGRAKLISFCQRLFSAGKSSKSPYWETFSWCMSTHVRLWRAENRITHCFCCLLHTLRLLKMQTNILK